MINTQSDWSDDAFYSTEVFIASTIDIATKFAIKNNLNIKHIKEINLDEDIVSLTGNPFKLPYSLSNIDDTQLDKYNNEVKLETETDTDSESDMEDNEDFQGIFYNAN
ncbi:hypothetical protein HOK00_01720 [bacterium]|nr:hypothetical protein [bacterium]